MNRNTIEKAAGLLVATGIVACAVAIPPQAPAPSVVAGASFGLEDARHAGVTLTAARAFFVPVAPVVLESGSAIGIGDWWGKTSTAPAPLSGAWWVREEVSLSVNGEPVTVKPQSLLFIGPEACSTEIVSMLSENGGVTCGNGFYACCGKNSNGQWVAKCIANNLKPTGGQHEPVTCTNGGPGATACTNGVVYVLEVVFAGE